MASIGLRELKKARTRQLIADTAARLFAERGYEHVAVADVARAAEVAEQTVYNYFPAKEQLVTDREEQVQDQLCELVRTRPAGVTAAGAIRGFALKSVSRIRDIPPGQWRGELGYLAAISPAVHRLALELTDRLAAALAVAIGETSNVPPEIARPQGIALASVFQIIISESGRRTRDGQGQEQIASELYPLIDSVLRELDRWLSVPRPLPGRQPGGYRPSSGGTPGRRQPRAFSFQVVIREPVDDAAHHRHAGTACSSTSARGGRVEVEDERCGVDRVAGVREAERADSRSTI